MKRNPRYLLILLLVFSLFFLVSCLPSTYDSTKGTIKGRIMVPSSPTKDITGWVPLPNAIVTLIDSEGNTHTVNTNSNGYYTIFNVAPGINYILTATGEVAGNTVILKDLIPQVEAGKTYDAATADYESTALALVVEALLAEGLTPEDIDPEQIQSTDNFLNLVSQVCLLLEQNGDVTSNPTVNSQIEEVIGEILPSETPPPPSPSPSPILSSNANLSNLLVSVGTLNPAFSPTITSYAVAVAYSVDTITFTPTAAHDKATITVKGSPVASGQPSTPISLSVGDNSIPIIVTAESGTTKTYTVIVNRNSPPILSSNANLSNLLVSVGTLNPAFSPTITSYAVVVAYSVDTITFTPTAAHDKATITVNGSSVTSGSTSSPISLNIGDNSIPIIVTAESGTTKTYTVIVNRNSPPILSSNANLSNLLVSVGTLNPAFSPTITSYAVAVAYSVDTITFTPTAAHDKATITVNGSSVTSGSTSSPISLNIGDNSIPIIVTAEDKTTQKTYTVIVNRSSPSDNANLSKLDIRYIGGVVSERNIKDPIYPTFDSDTTSYILHLVGTEDDIEVAATTEDLSASAIILYNGGLCVYFVQVTAEDGITQNNYAIQAYFYNSIKAALEGNSNLINEHMVTVVPRTYQEGDTINFPDKAIRLQSIDPEDNIVRENTIVQGDGATYRVFSFDGLSNLGSETNLTGFTIQNGYASDNGGGIYIGDHSLATITYNTISGNNSDTNGGGICILDNSSPIITNNTISGNESKNNGKGGGIAIYSNCSPIITNNTISGNTGKYGGGISIYGSSGSPPIITNNTISRNNSYKGGGIYITYNSSPDIKSNTISENVCADKGGGIYITSSGAPTIGGSDDSDKNTICGNDVNGISTNDNQVYPNDYDSINTNNYICASCDDSPCCDHCQ